MSVFVELKSDADVTQPTPVRIPLGGAQVPAGALLLRPETGEAPLPAQADGEGAIVTLVSDLLAGEPIRYRLTDADAPLAEVTLNEGWGVLELHLPEGELGVYHFGPDVVRPYLWPLFGPGQNRVTRDHPMEERAGEQRDHPHHRSLWTAYGEVNGVDDWSEETGHGAIRHRDFMRQEQGPVFGGFDARSLWTGPDGAPLLDEVRAVRVYNAGAEQRLLDYAVTLTAAYGDVEFGDTKEGGILSVRVATSMDGVRGGRIENADGGQGESACWGKPSAWCDYSGPVDGEIIGVAVLDHPGNPGHPARWHVRGYGLMTANPIATGAFTGGSARPVTLRRGESWNFRYRVLLHRGGAREGHVADAYQAFIAPPTGRVIEPS